jgi:hypothetical protein
MGVLKCLIRGPIRRRTIQRGSGQARAATPNSAREVAEDQKLAGASAGPLRQ